MYVYLSVRAEQHAVGIDQEDVAIGIEVAEDVRCRIAQHPVDRDAGGTGLVEVDRVAVADRERLPVDDRVLRTLVDVHRFAAPVVDRLRNLAAVPATTRWQPLTAAVRRKPR